MKHKNWSGPFARVAFLLAILPGANGCALTSSSPWKHSLWDCEQIVFLHDVRYVIVDDKLPRTQSDESTLSRSEQGALLFGTFQNWLRVSRPIESFRADLADRCSGKQLVLVLPIGPQNANTIATIRSQAKETGSTVAIAEKSLPLLWH